jgi:hypothetical protein
LHANPERERLKLSTVLQLLSFQFIDAAAASSATMSVYNHARVETAAINFPKIHLGFILSPDEY